MTQVMSTVRAVAPASGPLDGIVDVPGSKSIANRALVCAALAEGPSHVSGLPDGDDTVAMVRGLGALGVAVVLDGTAAAVTGTGGALPAGPEPVHVDAALAGTTSRFLTAVAALAHRTVVIDGAPPLRRRPMAPLHDALVELGARVAAGERAGHLPVTITGGLRRGGTIAMAGDVSSQYLTALMLVAPQLVSGLRITLTTPLVSAPYLHLTAAVMADFGLAGVRVDERAIVVPEGRYVGRPYHVEPDASAASYPLAMAAIAGGRVTVRDLSPDSRQGDIVVVELLAAMGCAVRSTDEGIEVRRDAHGRLHGLDIDMSAVSDLVPTVAVLATTACSPTTIRGVGFIRAKESDRLGDLAAELNATGADVTVLDDGLRITPRAGRRGAVLDPHHDHRLAMAFGVLGTAVAGISVREPDVVTKSWPGFWDSRDQLAGTAG